VRLTSRPASATLWPHRQVSLADAARGDISFLTNAIHMGHLPKQTLEPDVEELNCNPRAAGISQMQMHASRTNAVNEEIPQPFTVILTDHFHEVDSKERLN